MVVSFSSVPSFVLFFLLWLLCYSDFSWCLSFSVVSLYELNNLDAILFSVCMNESCIYIEHCESSCNHLAFKRIHMNLQVNS